VISTGSTETKRRLALELGAELAVDPGRPDWPAEVRRYTGKHGIDVAVEHIGGGVLGQVFQCLGRGGTVVTCGATAGKDVVMDLWPFFVKQQRLIGSYGRNRADLEATLAWAASGRLQPVIDSVVPLRECGAAFDTLRSRSALGKVLVVPG
jgi:alcohol dehydrogenase